MSYREQLQNAATWLESIQNSNGGWGRTKGLASSIANTAEALFVLKHANRDVHSTSVSRATEFIEANTDNSLLSLKRTRYALFTLEAASVFRDGFDKSFVDRVVGWLIRARNKDGGWGHEERDGESRLYPTVLAVLVLTHFRAHDEFTSAGNWIASTSVAGTWSFSPDTAPNLVATSMAVAALVKFRSTNDLVFERARSDLLTAPLWVSGKEDQPGADWIHSGHMWGFAALMALGMEPYVKPIVHGVVQINKLACKEGWREPDSHLTVRGQYWAVRSFEALQEGFDPAVHVYRIDSSRLYSYALEPEFVVIRPYTDWTIVLPAALYRSATYIALAVSVVLFLSINRLVPNPPEFFDFVSAVLLFLGSIYLVKKRRTLFPKRFNAVLFAFLVLLSIIDLVLGVSVTDIWVWINGWK